MQLHLCFDYWHGSYYTSSSLSFCRSSFSKSAIDLLEFKPASFYRVQCIKEYALLILRRQQADKRLTLEALQSARPDTVIRKSYRSCQSHVLMMAGQLKSVIAHRESISSWPAQAILDLSVVRYSLRLQGQRNSMVWLPVAP